MIKLQIIGNLGKDCIMKEVNGKTVINFSVAHTERYKDGQGIQKEKTTWVECAYWTDKTAVAPYLLKGKTVFAEGSPEVDLYTNRENQTAATLRMRVQNLQLVGGVGENTAQNSTNIQGAPTSYSAPVTNTQQNVSVPVADDLPF
jgi:single-strand DNA-binding protein